MKRLVLILATALVLLGLATPVQAGKACANCAPTTVTYESDGTFVFNTTAVPNGNCQGQASPTKYTCNLRVYDRHGVQVYGMAALPPISIWTRSWVCPCTAQFWVHSGQWQPFSAMSDSFIDPSVP